MRRKINREKISRRKINWRKISRRKISWRIRGRKIRRGEKSKRKRLTSESNLPPMQVLECFPTK